MYLVAWQWLTSDAVEPACECTWNVAGLYSVVSLSTLTLTLLVAGPITNHWELIYDMVSFGEVFFIKKKVSTNKEP